MHCRKKSEMDRLIPHWANLKFITIQARDNIGISDIVTGQCKPKRSQCQKAYKEIDLQYKCTVEVHKNVSLLLIKLTSHYCEETSGLKFWDGSNTQMNLTTIPELKTTSMMIISVDMDVEQKEQFAASVE